MNDIVIKSIRVKASYNFQSVEVEAEFPNGTSEQLTEAVQKRALELAVRQSELVEEHKKQTNFTRQEKNSGYQAKKYSSNPYMKEGNR